MALGATPAQVVRMALAQGLAPAAVGIVLGLIATAAVMRLVQTLLFDVKASDVGVTLAVTFAMMAVALAACAVPALRAARVEPSDALRAE